MKNSELFKFIPMDVPFNIQRFEIEFIHVLQLIKPSEARWFQYHGVSFTEDNKDIILSFKSSQSPLYINLKMGLFLYKDAKVKEDIYLRLLSSYSDLYENFREIKYNNL